MSKLNFVRQHDLSQSECKALAEKLLGKLVDRYGGSISQKKDQYIYKHNLGVNAVVVPNEGEFIVDVKLGLMARSFAPKLEGEMNRILDENLS